MSDINTPNGGVDNQEPVSKESIQVVKDPLLGVLDDGKYREDDTKIDIHDKKLNEFKNIISDILTEPGNRLLLHGTANKSIAELILKTGLRFSHGELDGSTAVWYNNDFKHIDTKSQNKILNDILNRPHFNCKFLSVISYPEIYRAKISNTYKEYSIGYKTDNGVYTRPEFVKGYFDVEKLKFINNKNYYKNLPPKEQETLFIEIKNNFMNSIVDSNLSLETYLKNNNDCPYTIEDIQRYKEIYGYEDPQETSDIRWINNNQNEVKTETINESNIEEGKGDRDR